MNNWFLNRPTYYPYIVRSIRDLMCKFCLLLISLFLSLNIKFTLSFRILQFSLLKVSFKDIS